MYTMILITVPNKKIGQKIAKKLLENKVVACVNIISGVSSWYWWQGRIDSAKELLLLAKTQSKHIKAVISKVKVLHPYTVPEIIAVPIIKGNKDYLEWINESVR